MTTTDQALETVLMSVEMEFSPEGERALNEWYATHIPRLIAAGGYRFGARYVASGRPRPYLALYELANRGWAPRLVGDDPSIRSEVVNAEAALCDQLPGRRRIITELYAQRGGWSAMTSRLLRSESAIAVLRLPGDNRCEPESSRRDGALVFDRIQMDELAHHGTISEVLVLCVADQLTCVSPPIAGWRRFRPLAKHWHL